MPEEIKPEKEALPEAAKVLNDFLQEKGISIDVQPARITHTEGGGAIVQPGGFSVSYKK